MTKDLWINLPVKEVEKSKAFFTHLGFPFNDKYNNQGSACMLVGKKPIVVMLFEENIFKNFTQNEVSDASKSSEMLLSFDAESVEEVDEMANKVIEAGGTIFGKPSLIQGWMYGFGFTDLDGHRWNMLYMDERKIS